MKWVDCDPYETIDWYTGEKKISTRYCFTIAELIWNKCEGSFDFESCGLRYLEHRADGLEKFIFDFCEMIEKEMGSNE